MAFSKTGVSFSPPTPLVVGAEKDGKFWDGEKWLSGEEWEKVRGKKEAKADNTFIGLG